MAGEIEADHWGEDLVMVAVLKGSVLFLADLVRAFPRQIAFDFIGVSSYGSSRSSLGVVTLEKEISSDIRGKSILLVDDILDTGKTLGWIKEHLQRFGPRQVKVCVLLEKQHPRVIEVKADYTGFSIPNVFVYGYGLDFEDKYRHLPYIARLGEGEAPPALSESRKTRLTRLPAIARSAAAGIFAKLRRP
jgi:hypoxanthine phosphoribosyltransferase